MPKIGMEPIRRTALVEATIHEIGKSGSLDVTVSQIAKRAGMSSGLAHHYFGSKEQLFASAMRHILTLYAAQMRGALLMAVTPRQRIEAIVRASFTPMSLRKEHVSAWMNFYVQAQKCEESERLLKVYQGRLHSNLLHEFRKIAPLPAEELALGVAAMIDGLYMRDALNADEQASERAKTTILHFIEIGLKGSALYDPT